MASSQRPKNPQAITISPGDSPQVINKGPVNTMRGSSGSTGKNYFFGDGNGREDGTRESSGSEELFLKSRVEVTDAYTSKDLGYIKLIAEHRNDNKLTLVPGSTYKLSFDMYCLAPWQFFVSDGAHADILPGVLIYSPTAAGGSTDAVLMSDGTWIASNEPVTNGGLAPFVNIIDNGDFHDISDTGMLLDEALSVGDAFFDVDGTGVDTSSAWAGAHLSKIFVSEGTNVPGSNWDDTIGVCTAVTDDTQDVLHFIGHRSSTQTGSQIAALNNDKLYTLDGWKLGGTRLWPTWLSTNMRRDSEDNHTFGIEHLDGGRNGTSVLKLSTHHDIWTAPVFNFSNWVGTLNTNNLYQEIELDGNCLYDLHFKYSQTTVPTLDGSPDFLDENAVTAICMFDVFDKERNVSLIGGWTPADSNALQSDVVAEGTEGGVGGNSVNLSFCEQNSFFSHCNQYYDDLTDTIKFGYVKFFVPPLATEANSVTVSIRFTIHIPQNTGLIDKAHSIFLSFVSVKKSFPDLAHLSRGRSTLLPARGLSRRFHIESFRDKFYDKWQNYELSFTVPSDYSEKDDWEMRFYGGSFGTTKDTKSALISGVTLSSTTATYASTSHGFSLGDRITISGTTNFNDANLANNIIQSVGTHTFTMTVSSGGAVDESSIIANAELINTSYYPNTQTVGIKNIKLMSNNYKFGEEHSDHILLLADNKTDKTSLTMYHTNNNYWDASFYVNQSFKFSPIYTYVNGLLQISNADFTDNTNLIRWFYVDRTVADGTVHKGFVLSDNVFPNPSSLVIEQSETLSSYSSYMIDALRILGNTYATFEFWPNDNLTGFQSTSGTNNPEGNQPWHNKWFHGPNPDNANFFFQDINYKYTGVHERCRSIPLVYIPESHESISESTEGYINDNVRHFRHTGQSEDFESDPSSVCWKPGGIHVSGCASSDFEAAGGDYVYLASADYPSGDPNGQSDTGVNNSVKSFSANIPIMGGDYGIIHSSWPTVSGAGGDTNENWYGPHKDMTAALANIWPPDNAYIGDVPLKISYINMKINVYATVLRYLPTYDNSSSEVYFNYMENSLFDWPHMSPPKLNINIYRMIDGELTNEILATLQGTLDVTNNEYISQGSIYGQSEGDSVENGYISNLDGDSYSAAFVGPLTPMTEVSGRDYVDLKFKYNFNFSWDDPEGEFTPSSDKNLVMKIDFDCGTSHYWNMFYRAGYAFRWPDGLQQYSEGEDSQNHDFTTGVGFNFEKLDIGFYEPLASSDEFGSATDEGEIRMNFNFVDVEGEYTDNWVARQFIVGITTVNYFDEESIIHNLAPGAVIGAGDNESIQPGQAPNIVIHVGKGLVNNPMTKKIKIYFKEKDQDIWYKQFSINTETGKIKSSTSSEEFDFNIQTGISYIFELDAKKMLHFNEVDSYEAETLIPQEDAESYGTITCTYKTSVHANNRLYVGNIKQGGRTYGDRMLKTPIGKYNVFPSSSYIDVAIIDGDEITGLAYFKDKLLQFKKRKVFVINISGDYEALEDTFQHVGINKQCQIVTTPHGICWVNSRGCFLYDGEKMENLIENKIGAASYQATGIGGTENYWSILNSYSPGIGYISESKTLIIAKHTGWNSSAQTTSMASKAIEGFTYDFQSKGWTFLMNKLTCTPESTSTANTGLLSNFVNNQDGDVLFYAVGASSDSGSINSIYKWQNKSTSATDATDEDVFYLSTKDFDFGSPGIRKKIYKVYVTFKSVDDSGGSAGHQDSEVLVKYFTNGAVTGTKTFADSTNYSAAKGLFDSGGGTNWTIAELKPNTSSEANNIYSFQLQFLGKTSGAGDIPNLFEINDITIVYREKNIK